MQSDFIAISPRSRLISSTPLLVRARFFFSFFIFFRNLSISTSSSSLLSFSNSDLGLTILTGVRAERVQRCATVKRMKRTSPVAPVFIDAARRWRVVREGRIYCLGSLEQHQKESLAKPRWDNHNFIYLPIIYKAIHKATECVTINQNDQVSLLAK